MLDELVEQRDWIAGPNRARLNHRRVEAAQAPARRLRVAGLHLRIVHRSLDAWTIDVELVARLANFGQLDHDRAHAIALSDPQSASIEASRRKIFAERSWIEREPERAQFLDSFRGDQQQGLLRSAVKFGMRLHVAGDAERGDVAGGDRALGDAAARDVDLEDSAGHLSLLS